MISSEDKNETGTSAEPNRADNPAIKSKHNSQFSILNYQLILRRYWGYDDFRGIQKEIIESIASGHDTLGLMPTGGGKSITFQVPAMAMEGVCIVVTPLIALMKDQVQNLRKRGIRASAVYSGLSHDQILMTLENCIFGGVKILYVSPERLSSELFVTKLRHMRVSFLTVDEAHCISQWGYDFRPSYLKIAEIRHELPDVPVLALTATATPQVVQDIQEKLEEGGTRKEEGGKTFNVFQMSFARKNLAYVVRHAEDKEQELEHILRSVAGTAIVYVRSRQRTKEIAKALNDAGISATYYHAGLENQEKDLRQRQWQNDEKRVMVATNAFGMGIDKADVRVVVHIDCPDSIEAYFQEAGRAGRDGLKAYAVMLHNKGDHMKLLRRVSDNFPDKEYIRRVYAQLAYHYQIATGSGYGATFEFNVEKFCYNFHHFPTQVISALHILSRAGYIDFAEEHDSLPRVMFTIGRNDLYRLENTTADEERVITTLLRGYGGLFTDYAYIDEAMVAEKSGLSRFQLYQLLKNLSARHILSYIPQRKMPLITYLQRREDPERIVLSKEVYEDRLEQYRQRINAMIDYATNDNVCRQRQLLRYFGERRSSDCGCCDVCQAHRHDGTLVAEERLSASIEAIMQLLDDGKQHTITEIHNIQLPKEELDAALEYLLYEEEILMEDSKVIIAK